MEEVVFEFSDEEMDDFTIMFVKMLETLCWFADKHNFDRDNILTYTAQYMSWMSEVSTIENYEVGE